MSALRVVCLASLLSLGLAAPALAGSQRVSTTSTQPPPGPTRAIPEPGALAVFALGAGLVALGARRIRSQRG